MPRLHSLSTVRSGEWIFKASEYEGNILIVAFSPIYKHSIARYFTSENEAHNWVEYLIMTSGMIKQELQDKDE